MKLKTIAVVLLACASAVSAGNLDEAKYTDTAEKTAHQLRDRILAAANALPNHPWAGEYYCGDGLGVNVSLLLAPEAGFVFEWHGCLGLYDRNYGAIAETNGRIHLSCTFKNERKGFQGFAEEFIPVPWGERRYLIPADDMVGFCNKVNDGTEPRDDGHGFYLLRAGDENKAVSGFPVLPDEYGRYLLTNPIVAEITDVLSATTRPSVCEWRFKDTTVILNAGRNRGLLEGMELHVATPANLVESVVVTKVEETTAEAVMTQTGEDRRGPENGWQLSTRCPWNEKQELTTKGARAP